MFKEALFKIAKVWRQQKCPSINSWLNKMYVYTMEYYSTIKKAEILSFDTWMDLENIIRKGKYCYHLLWNLKKKNECMKQNINGVTDTGNKLVVTR